MQTIIAVVLLTSAVGFMLWKFVGKRLLASTSQSKTDCGPDCKCG